MRVKLAPPVVGMSGRTRNSDYVLVKRGNITYARAYSPPSNPQTKDQVAARRFLVTATKSWGRLTQAQRDAWDAYARLHYSEQTPEGANQKSGYNIYGKIQYYRQAMGMPLLADAPTQPPPPAPIRIVQEISASDVEFRFRLDHEIPADAAAFVLFEITKAMPSPGRKPRVIELRMIRTLGPASFLPFRDSEKTYEIGGAQFEIATGKRYGARARLLTAEGVPSDPIPGDFIREIGWVAGADKSSKAVQQDLF